MAESGLSPLLPQYGVLGVTEQFAPLGIGQPSRPGLFHNLPPLLGRRTTKAATGQSRGGGQPSPPGHIPTRLVTVFSHSNRKTLALSRECHQRRGSNR